MADPKGTLAAEGMAVPEGMDLRVVENTPGVTYVVLPEPPFEGELSEADTAAVHAAGWNMSGGSG